MTVLPVGSASQSAFEGAPAMDPVPFVDPRVEALWPLSVAEFGVPILRRWSEQDLQARFVGDPWLDNLLLNKWEFAHRKSVLKSFPWRLSVPFVLCNAKCDFCAAWLMKGRSSLEGVMTSLVPVVRHAHQLDLVGWGEPLIHPQFAAVLAMIKQEADPRARIALTTNGTRLERWIDRLLEANIMEYAVSVHAATKETHQDLMGFGPDVFERVIYGVWALTAKKAQFPDLKVGLAFVVTQQNVAEIPELIRLGERLGVDEVHLRTLMPMDPPREGLDYHRLPPYLHADFERLREAAVQAIARTALHVRADPASWSQPVFSPEWEARLTEMPLTPRNSRKSYRMGQMPWDQLGAGEYSPDPAPAAADDPLGREASLYCPSPYTAFYVNGTDRRMIPCVYMHKVPDHAYMHFKPSMTFDEAWNAPAMVAVRRSLHEGPLMPACLKCPFDC